MPGAGFRAAARRALVDCLLISWSYPLFKNIETLKFAEFRHFRKTHLWGWPTPVRGSRGLLITPAFSCFSQKIKEKSLQLHGHLLNLWLNFGEYRFLCFPM